ncbi:MAG: gluconokinase [Chitinophaga sp.]|uniref:gluconokinase n=1 Tax=Chitinophaga sp. TaxID=1869181 RepID=UPI0025BAF101|nr:gluconokinase [Chitinophaga sp.]MBV8254606.1 gluconokinase [Chitinophaga sp.]
MNDTTAYFIGSDIGTSSTKSISLGIDGTMKNGFQQAYTTQHPQSGYSEQDPAVILQAVKDGIRQIVLERQQAPAAVCFSSAMHSLLAVDGQGKPLTPLIIWADNRSHSQAEALRASALGKEIYEHTGTPIHAMSPLCKLMWLREEQPEIFEEAHCFMGIKEYIIQELFGQPLVDHSIASAMGLFDIRKHTWYAPALATAGITADRLPQPVPANYIIRGLKPAIAAEMGIPADTPFVIGASDGCLAQLGSNAIAPGHATLTIGTSGAVRMAVPKAMSDHQQRLFTYLLTDDIYITGGASNNGGVLLQWLLKDFLQLSVPMETMIQEALALGPQQLLCLPYLLGERAPIWDSNASAAFIGIRPAHGQVHFTRAVMESICFAVKSIAAALEETAGPIHKISVSGGFAKSPGWIQLMADIFGKTLTLEDTTDASALGAIRLAAQVMGMELEMSKEGQEQVFVPDMQYAEHYQEQYRKFWEVYLALKQI